MNKSRILWVVLIFSLLANVFLLGGALYTRHIMDGYRDGEPQVERIVEALDLTAPQQAKLQEVAEQMQAWRAERNKRREEGSDETREEMFALLMVPEFDEARLRELLQVRHAERNERFVMMGREMHGFMQTLSAEQQAKALEMMRDRSFWRYIMGGRGRR